jgi:hypothetical protein
VQQGAHQGQFLAHTLGVFSSALEALFIQAKFLQQGFNPRSRSPLLDPIHLGKELQIFQGVHAPIQTVMLGEHPDRSAHLLRLPDHIKTCHLGCAAGGS